MIGIGTEIIIIIAALCFIWVCYILVQVFRRMEKSLRNVEHEVHSMTVRTLPVLENMEAITTKIRSVTDNIDEQMNLVRNTLGVVRRSLEDIVDFKQRIQHKLEEPAMETASFLSGILRGVKTFFNVLQK